jgi:hypothetical protein
MARPPRNYRPNYYLIGCGSTNFGNNKFGYCKIGSNILIALCSSLVLFPFAGRKNRIGKTAGGQQ